MNLESLATSLVVGNFFVLSGLFVTILLMFRYSVQVSTQLKEFKNKIQEQDKKIQTLQSTQNAVDVISSLLNPSMGGYTSSTSLSSKKPSAPASRSSLTILKGEGSKSDEDSSK